MCIGWFLWPTEMVVDGWMCGRCFVVGELCKGWVGGGCVSSALPNSPGRHDRRVGRGRYLSDVDDLGLDAFVCSLFCCHNFCHCILQGGNDRCCKIVGQLVFSWVVSFEITPFSKFASSQDGFPAQKSFGAIA